MVLSEKQKIDIKNEYQSWFDKQYGEKTLKEDQSSRLIKLC